MRALYEAKLVLCHWMEQLKAFLRPFVAPFLQAAPKKLVLSGFRKQQSVTPS
jgi:hypothetical protein